MAAEAFLGFRGSREFLNVAIAAFLDSGTVGASCHVRMTSCSVTVHTRHTFVDVIAVCEFYDFLFHLIAKIQDLWMAV